MTFQSSTPQAFRNVQTASTVGSLRRSRRRKSCTVLGGKPVRRERRRTGGSPAQIFTRSRQSMKSLVVSAVTGTGAGPPGKP
jgi:hypothetical protein